MAVIIAVVTVFSLVSVIVGNMIAAIGLLPLTRNPNEWVFLKLLYGGSIVVALHAIVGSGLETILALMFVVLALGRVMQFAPKQGLELVGFIREMKFLGGGIITFTLMLLVQLVYAGADNLEPDLLFYAKIAEFLHISGENKFHGFIDQNSDFRGTIPYHYFELWFTNATSRISGLTTSVLLQYLTYPYFKTLLVIGLVSYHTTEPMSNLRFISKSLIIVLITLVPIGVLLNFLPVGWEAYGNIWVRPNLIFYTLFLLPIFSFIRDSEYNKAILYSLLIPIVSITTAPAYFITAGILCAVLFWASKQTQYMRLLGILIGVAVATLMFYYFFGSNVKLFLHPPWREMLLSQLEIYKALIAVATGLIIQVLCVGAVLAGMIFYSHMRSGPQLGVSVLLSVIGILLFQSVPLIDNSYQFAYLGYASLNLVLFMVLSHYVLNESTVHKLIAGGMILMVGLFSFDMRTTAIDKMDSKSLAEFSLRLNGYSLNGIGRASELLSDDERLAFTLDRQALEEVFVGKRRHMLTMQLGSELSYLHHRLRFYPIIPEKYLYSFPDSSAGYYKARSFNMLLKSYSLVSENPRTEDFLAFENVRWLLRNSRSRNMYEPRYIETSGSVNLKERLYLVKLGQWR